MSARTEWEAQGRERGVALVLVIWVLALLALLATSFSFAARTETLLATGSIDLARGGALADAGLRRAIAGLLVKDAELRWSADGAERRIELPGGSVTVRVGGEHGKMDLNAAPAALLRNLLEHIQEQDAGLLESPESVLDAILDWRDRDDRKRPNGAEDGDYARADSPWGAADAPFLTVSELGRVAGVSPRLLARLTPLLTVHSGRPQVDAASAPREVLLAVPGLTPDVVEQLVAARPGPLPLELVPSQARRYLARGRPSVYAITSEGVTAGGARVTHGAVVRITGDRRRPWLVLAWHEGVDAGPVAAPAEEAAQ